MVQTKDGFLDGKNLEKEKEMDFGRDGWAGGGERKSKGPWVGRRQKCMTHSRLKSPASARVSQCDSISDPETYGPLES